MRRDEASRTGRCGVALSGLGRCAEPTFGRRRCGYHAKLARGLVSLHLDTFRAIRRGAEGDLARSEPYAAALRRARAELEEARVRARLRDRRRELEALLLLACAGDLRAWRRPAPGAGPPAGSDGAQPRRHLARRRIRVWRA